MKKKLYFIAICMVIGLKHEIYAGPASSLIAVNRYFQAKQILAGNIDKLNEPLNDYGLALLTVGELRLLRNTVYARYGYIFKNDELVEYFTNFSWYTPAYSNVDDKLTDIDKQNLDLIKLYENISDKQESIVSSNQLFFSWGEGYLEGNSAPAKFYFYNEGEVTYTPSDRECSYLLGWRGVYSVKGNILYIRVKEIFYNPFVAFMPNAFPYNLQKIVVDPGIELRFPLSKITERKVKDCTGKDVDSTILYIGTMQFVRYFDEMNDEVELTPVLRKTFSSRD